MTPTKSLSPLLVSKWARDLAENPLEEKELEELGDPSNPQSDPELALTLEPDGTPVWWPSRHPESREKLPKAKRRKWFLDWLAGELSPVKESLRAADARSRRRTIARSLHRIQSDSRLYDLPTPDL